MSCLLRLFFIPVAVCLTGMTAAAAGERVDNNVVACRQIKTAAQLQAMQNNLAGVYCLANDIDAGSIANFAPIGGGAAPFTGRLYGNGHVIRNLTVNSATTVAGLIGAMTDGLVQDVGLVNVNVSVAGNGYAGGLVGFVGQNVGGGTAVTITRVYSTGQVKCTSVTCLAGGLIGLFFSPAPLTDVGSSAHVVSAFIAGGLVGENAASAISRSYATGSVDCIAPNCVAGGLAGFVFGNAANPASVSESYASGPVTGGASVQVGGLVGQNQGGTIVRSFATGPVVGGDTADVGALVGFVQNGVIKESYGAGNLTGGAGALMGGLIGTINGAPTITNAYWDTVTSHQAAGFGMGLTTAQLRGALPAGFGKAWSFTNNLSYPFLNGADAFTSPLATLVTGGKIFTFLPISQFDMSQYKTRPVHADGAALATVYTMISNAIGITDNVAQLKGGGAFIDSFNWHDATQTTTFTGPVLSHRTVGPLILIPANKPLNGTNVIGHMNVQRLVLLRGTYTKSGGAKATHWMLGTNYTRDSANNPAAVVANDPWTGTQVTIDPATKQVLSPANFPLANFTVDGFQAVTVN